MYNVTVTDPTIVPLSKIGDKTLIKVIACPVVPALTGMNVLTINRNDGIAHLVDLNNGTLYERSQLESSCTAQALPGGDSVTLTVPAE